MTMACRFLTVLSIHSLSLHFDDVDVSSSVSESLPLLLVAECWWATAALLFRLHFSDAFNILKLSKSSNGLSNWLWFDDWLQFSSGSMLRRPYAFRGGRWLFFSRYYSDGWACCWLWVCVCVVGRMPAWWFEALHKQCINQENSVITNTATTATAAMK